MADVTEDRGQLLLISALGLAILLVSLALVVNTAIYTENLATRSSKAAGGTQAIQYQESAEDGLRGLVVYVNYHDNTSFDAVYSNLSTGVTDWNRNTGTHFSTSGVGVNLSLADARNGTRIEQTDQARNFSNASLSSSDWTVASNVDDTRRFRINVTDKSALDDPDDSPFQVIVDDGSNTWRMNVSEDSGDIVVGIDSPGASGTCRTSAVPARINLTAGSLNGQPCDPLVFAEGLSPPYSIRYGHVDKIEGTYSLIVTNTTLADSPGPHLNSPGGGSPFATHAIYDADVRYVYQSPRIYLERTLRIAPGDSHG